MNNVKFVEESPNHFREFNDTNWGYAAMVFVGMWLLLTCVEADDGSIKYMYYDNDAFERISWTSGSASAAVWISIFGVAFLGYPLSRIPCTRKTTDDDEAPNRSIQGAEEEHAGGLMSARLQRVPATTLRCNTTPSTKPATEPFLWQLPLFF